MSDDPEAPTHADRRFLVPPTDEQLDLLRIVWDPFSNGQGWPVWDYVARTLFRAVRTDLNLEQLWLSLPRLPPSRVQERTYGLVWESARGLLIPAPDEHVGLSIAGMNSLRGLIPAAGRLSDAIAAGVGLMAQWDRSLTPEVDAPVSIEKELADECRKWLDSAGLGHFNREQASIIQLLQFERGVTGIRADEHMRTGVVTLRGYLSPFLGVDCADAYLRILESQAAPARPRPMPSDGLSVAHAMDYLDLALRAHPAWGPDRTHTAVDLRSAGVVALDVSTESDYRQALSAVSTLLESLNPPALPEAELGPHGGRQPGSLARLEKWIEMSLGDAGAVEAAKAIDDLRAVVRLRVEGQHAGASNRRTAQAARDKLGIPSPVYDWPDAWHIARGRAVDALLTIAHEVRSGRA